MKLTEASCPRCGARDFSANFTGLISLSLSAAATEGQITSKAYSDGSDAFVDLTCTDCRLTLATPPGDTRLRRAQLYNTPEDLTEGYPAHWDSTNLQDPAYRWFVAMVDIAEQLCVEVINLDTEVINEVIAE